MSGIRTLAIDIGGTGIKAALLDDSGQMVSERRRVPTPAKPVAPGALLRAIDEVSAGLGEFERVSVGFPGYVRQGKVLTAPNLGTEALAGFDLQTSLAEHWDKPVRVLNDADVQGFGAIRGKGIEMVLTLGTGAGTAIFRDGEVMPHLELAHHPISGKKTYDQYIGNAARKKKGRKTWNKRVVKVITVLRTVVRFDHLYLGGGNAAEITFSLPADVSVVPNTDGLTGGIGLWRADPPPRTATGMESGAIAVAAPDRSDASGAAEPSARGASSKPVAEPASPNGRGTADPT